MVPHMICVLPFQTSVGTIRRLRISVPLIECRIDGVRYLRPDDLPPAGGETQADTAATDHCQALLPLTGNVARLAVTA